ncbi:MAG TPA: GNAT family N-acetyltransferase [Thermomicrobiales bacterium]
MDGTRIITADFPDGASELGLELDGARVSRVVIIPMLMRIGEAVVRMDGIGGVETEEAYQKRGYSRRLMEAAVARMRAGNAALSTLFGIQDFYHKFGFTTVGPEYTVTLPLWEQATTTAALPAGWSARALAPDDLAAVMRLYHLNTRRATGALMRHDGGDESAETLALAEASPKARQIGQRAWGKLGRVVGEPGQDACRVVLGDSGEIVAYAWLGQPNWWMGVRREEEPRGFHVAEVMASDPIAAEAVLAVCRQWAAETRRDHSTVRMAMPPAGPVANAAAYEGGSFLAEYTRAGDFMGRVLDVGRLVVQMRPEFSARIAAARLGFWGEVVLRSELGEAAMTVAPEGVTVGDGTGDDRLVIELPQGTLARLCLGAFETDDLLARLPVALDPVAEGLLRVLFPRRAPFIYPVDRF